MEYKIGSINMKRFGRFAKKDFTKIAEIIIGEDLDVVAMQEVFSEGQGIERLKQEVKKELYNWDSCWGVPKETKDNDKISGMIKDDTRNEGYAYLWNKKRFKLVEFSENGLKRKFMPRIVQGGQDGVFADCSVFARAPYYIRLQPLYGGFFELRLINIHVFFGSQNLSDIVKRQVEFDILTQQIYPGIATRSYGQNRIPYTIAMGDYNLNIFTPGIDTLYKNCYLASAYIYYEGNREIKIATEQRELTTLKKSNNHDSSVGTVNDGYANNFDHFTYSEELSPFQNVSIKAIDAVNKYCDGNYEYYLENISDHIPIVMTIEI